MDHDYEKKGGSGFMHIIHHQNTRATEAYPKGAAVLTFVDFAIQPATPQCRLPGDSNETSGFAHAKSTTKDH